MSANDLKEIELSIADAQESIDKKSALSRLRDNKDFKNIIEVGFLEKEAIQAVQAKAEPALQAPEIQQAIDNMIIAIGYFRRYLNKIMADGENATRAIEDYRNTRDEIMAED